MKLLSTCLQCWINWLLIIFFGGHCVFNIFSSLIIDIVCVCFFALSCVCVSMGSAPEIKLMMMMTILATFLLTLLTKDSTHKTNACIVTLLPQIHIIKHKRKKFVTVTHHSKFNCYRELTYAEKCRRIVAVMSILHTGQCAHPVAVELMVWRHVQHKQCPVSTWN